MKRTLPQPSPPELAKTHSHGTRSQFFGMVLYPEEDLYHKAVIDFIQTHPDYYEYIMIKHKGEIDEDENQKKDHVHLMYKRRFRSTLLAEIKYWCGNVKHIESISSPDAYAQYMIHDTFACIQQNKTMYSVDDVEGTPDLKLKFYVIRGSENLYRLASYCKEVCGSIFDVLDYINMQDDKEDLLACFYKYQHMLICASNQIYKKEYKN